MPLSPDDLVWEDCNFDKVLRQHAWLNGVLVVHKWADFFYCLGPEGDGLNHDVSNEFRQKYQRLVPDKYGNKGSIHAHRECSLYSTYHFIPCVEAKDWNGVLKVLRTVEADIEGNIKLALAGL